MRWRTPRIEPASYKADPVQAMDSDSPFSEFVAQSGADGTVRMGEGCHADNGIHLAGASWPICGLSLRPEDTRLRGFHLALSEDHMIEQERHARVEISVARSGRGFVPARTPIDFIQRRGGYLLFPLALLLFLGVWQE